jgi:predicted transcriptional regulator
MLGILMGRSKFEIYVAVLETLALDGPMRPNKITCETSINYSVVKKAVNDLRNRQLVDERKVNNNFIYSATPKAKLALLQYKEIAQSLPIFEETM